MRHHISSWLTGGLWILHLQPHQQLFIFVRAQDSRHHVPMVKCSDPVGPVISHVRTTFSLSARLLVGHRAASAPLEWLSSEMVV